MFQFCFNWFLRKEKLYDSARFWWADPRKFEIFTAELFKSLVDLKGNLHYFPPLFLRPIQDNFGIAVQSASIAATVASPREIYPEYSWWNTDASAASGCKYLPRAGAGKVRNREIGGRILQPSQYVRTFRLQNLHLKPRQVFVRAEFGPRFL